MWSSNERAARSAVYMVLHRFICSTVQQARVQTDSVPFDLDGSDIPVTLCSILSYTAHQDRPFKSRTQAERLQNKASTVAIASIEKPASRDSGRWHRSWLTNHACKSADWFSVTKKQYEKQGTGLWEPTSVSRLSSTWRCWQSWWSWRWWCDGSCWSWYSGCKCWSCWCSWGHKCPSAGRPLGRLSKDQKAVHLRKTHIFGTHTHTSGLAEKLQLLIYLLECHELNCSYLYFKSFNVEQFLLIAVGL